MHRGKTLLMVASSWNPDLLRTPRDLGLRVVLLARRPPADASRYDVHLDVDEMDEAATLAAVDDYLASGGQIDAVASFHEGSQTVSAAVAARLGLPGNSPQAALAMKDKHRTAELLASAGVPAPRSYLVNSPDEASAAAEKIGFPAVMKPQSSSSSQGVVKVRDAAEAASAYEMISGLYTLTEFRSGQFSVPNVGQVYFHPTLRGVVVQQYVEGPEFAADVVYGAGAYQVLAVHGKPSPWSETYFIERMYVTPPQVSAAEEQALRDTAVRALQAVGATVGGAHVEMRSTPDGPTVIEVNGRLGGTTAYVQESIRESTGVWGPLEYLRAVLGERPRAGAHRRPAGFTAVLAEETGCITGFTGVEETMQLPGVLGIRWMAKPGDHVVIAYPANPVSCFALVLATGPTQRDVVRTLERAERTLRPVIATEGVTT